MSATRILVADDHEVVRRGIRALLESQPGWKVCGEAVTGEEAVQKTKSLEPDVVVLDIGMPELNGLEATRRIRKEAPKSEVLILTMHESEQVVREVLAAGARGYVLKSDAGRDLIAAVKAVRNHSPFFTSRVATMVLDGYLKGKPGVAEGLPTSRLTVRERQVVQLLAEGHSTKQAASALGVAVRPADTHRTNIMRKLDIHSLSELVRYAIRNRIIEA